MNSHFWRKRDGLLGFDAWLLLAAMLPFVPDGNRLWVSMGVLALTVLGLKFVFSLPSSFLTAAQSGLVSMMLLSILLPIAGKTAWWSFVVVAAFGASFVMARLKQDHERRRFLSFMTWFLIIGLVSGGAGGSGGWQGWLVEVLGLTPEQADIAIVNIRKTIHFVYYGTLAVLAVRYFKLVTPSRPIAAAVALTLGIAAYDECRQLFTPFRTGSLRDFGLDALGMVCCLAVWWRIEGQSKPSV